MTDYLTHHGITGQKWGQRNGPPYPLSRQAGHGNGIKYGSAASMTKDIKKVRENSSEDHKNVRTKRLDEMTNDELRRVVDRLQLEQRYVDYVVPKDEKSTIQKVRDFMSTVASDASNIAKITTSYVAIRKAIRGDDDNKRKKNNPNPSSNNP